MGDWLSVAHLGVLLVLELDLVVGLRVLVMVGHALVHVAAVRLIGGRAWIRGRLRVAVRGVSLSQLIGGLVALLHHGVLAGGELLLLLLLVRVAGHWLLPILGHLGVSE